MFRQIRRWLRDPVILLCLTAGLLAFVVQSGELGSADTMHRLQTAHSFWTSEPPVFPQEYPEFGLYGRGGKLYDWYGMGQPLLMLPADVVGTFLERLPIFDDYRGTDPSIRSIFVSYTTNILIAVVTALVCFRFLQLLEFSAAQSVTGVLALLVSTTHLHYTHNMMENNYIMLLTLTGFTFQYEWLRNNRIRSLIVGSGALGLNLLTRLTTGLDLLAVGAFLLLVLWFERERATTFWTRFLAYAKVSVPTYAWFFLIDRLYQHHRFGSFFNTYVTLFAQKYKALDPTLPANYPWETPFHIGFLGPLLTPEKSILLFDPLIVLTILVVALVWKRFQPGVRAYIVASSLMLLGYVCLYARYTVWSGDFAWGDRYVSTAVEFAAFISVPLLLRYRTKLGRLVWGTGLTLIIISGIIQGMSLAFWVPLEIYQMETLGHPTFVILLRLKNIVAFTLGKMDAWGLTNPAMTEDPWDYVHINTWNFLPFLLRRVGEAPAWVVRIAFAMWGVGLAVLAIVLVRLRQALTTAFTAEG